MPFGFSLPAGNQQQQQTGMQPFGQSPLGSSTGGTSGFGTNIGSGFAAPNSTPPSFGAANTFQSFQPAASTGGFVQSSGFSGSVFGSPAIQAPTPPQTAFGAPQPQSVTSVSVFGSSQPFTAPAAPPLVQSSFGSSQPQQQPLGSAFGAPFGQQVSQTSPFGFGGASSQTTAVLPNGFPSTSNNSSNNNNNNDRSAPAPSFAFGTPTPNNLPAFGTSSSSSPFSQPAATSSTFAPNPFTSQPVQQQPASFLTPAFGSTPANSVTAAINTHPSAQPSQSIPTFVSSFSNTTSATSFPATSQPMLPPPNTNTANNTTKASSPFLARTTENVFQNASKPTPLTSTSVQPPNLFQNAFAKAADAPPSSSSSPSFLGQQPTRKSPENGLGLTSSLSNPTASPPFKKTMGGAIEIVDNGTAKDDRARRFAANSSTATIRETMQRERDEREKTYYASFKQKQLDQAHDVVGTCLGMCPEFERYDREVTQELHYFEMIPGTQNDPVPQVDHAAAVKKYRRSAAGKDPEIFPEDIRPPAVLKKTMDYLMTTILQRADQDFVEIYNFVRDRGRALRKDFKVQNHLKGPECVDVMERLSRFLIHADFMLCEQPESKFSWKQNRHQMVDTLTTLNEIYDDELKRGISYPNEAEFRAYYILLNLKDPVAVSRVQTWRSAVIKESIVALSMEIYACFQNRFFHRFFQLVRSGATTYLMACILQFYFSKVRSEGLRALSNSFTNRDKPFPVPALRSLLAFDSDQDVLDFCNYWGYENSVEDDGGVQFTAIYLGKKDARSAWIEPVGQLKTKASGVVAGKKGGAAHVDIVSGKASISERPASPAVAITPLPPPAKPLPFSLQPSFSFQPAKQLPTIVAESPTTIPVSTVDVSPPVPVKVEKPDYQKHAPSVLDPLLESVVDELKRDVAEMLLSKYQGCQVFAQHILAQLLQEVLDVELRTLVVSAISRATLVHQICASTSKDIYVEIIEEQITLCAKEELSEARLRTRRLHSTFRPWRVLARARVHEKKQKAERRRRYVESIRSMPLMAPSPPKGKFAAETFVFMPSNSRSHISSALSIEDSLRSLELGAQKAKQTLDLADLFHHTFVRRKLRISYVRLMLSTDIDARASDILKPWFLQKFEIGGVPEDMEVVEKQVVLSRIVENLDVKTMPIELIGPSASLRRKSASVLVRMHTQSFFTMMLNGGGMESPRNRRLAVLVQSMDFPSEMDADTPVVREKNASSWCSGTNAAVFYCSIWNTDESISHDRRRLRAFLGGLPRKSTIPLLVVYWSEHHDESMSDRIRFKLDLQEYERIGYLASFRVQRLGVLADPRSSAEGYDKLREGIRWVAENVPGDPSVLTGPYEDYLASLAYPIFSETLQKLASKFPRENLLDLRAWVCFFGMYVEMHNALVKSFADIVASEEMESAAWPARDVKERLENVHLASILPDMAWNAEETLKLRKDMILRYLLEKPDSTSITDYKDAMRSITIWFKNYVERLGDRLPAGADSDQVKQMTFVLTLAEPEGALFMLLESLTAQLLSRLHQDLDRRETIYYLKTREEEHLNSLERNLYDIVHRFRFSHLAPTTVTNLARAPVCGKRLVEGASADAKKKSRTMEFPVTVTEPQDEMLVRLQSYTDDVKKELAQLRKFGQTLAQVHGK